jgi:CheY-like chemotaxis protein
MPEIQHSDRERAPEVTVLLAEDDEGHALLIKRNLKRAGLECAILHFGDGEQILNFLMRRGHGPHRKAGMRYVALLDIRMPKVDGVEVLRRLKADDELRKLPVIMVTTANDPRDVEQCHHIGCSTYLTKPVDYDRFVDAIVHLGQFLKSVEIPAIGRGEE